MKKTDNTQEQLIAERDMLQKKLSLQEKENQNLKKRNKKFEKAVKKYDSSRNSINQLEEKTFKLIQTLEKKEHQLDHKKEQLLEVTIKEISSLGTDYNISNTSGNNFNKFMGWLSQRQLNNSISLKHSVRNRQINLLINTAMAIQDPKLSRLNVEGLEKLLISIGRKIGLLSRNNKLDERDRYIAIYTIKTFILYGVFHQISEEISQESNLAPSRLKHLVDLNKENIISLIMRNDDKWELNYTINDIQYISQQAHDLFKLRGQITQTQRNNNRLKNSL